tara:strand:- start:286 stop:903 length:618 start_codon:yes stop_codon:yes gene_type:complete
MTEKKEGKIGCKCGKAEITIADGTAIHRIFCACEDCRQALEWASLHGAEQPDTLPDLYYLPSDILAWKGEDYMRAVKLREDGRAVRVFCKNCFSMIAADHPAFQSNVLCIAPKHCKTDCDLTVPPTAYLFMNDFKGDPNFQPVENIPVFHTLKYNEERKRWVNLPATSRALCPRTEAPVGQTLTEFLQKLEPIEVLSLSRGETLI